MKPVLVSPARFQWGEIWGWAVRERHKDNPSSTFCVKTFSDRVEALDYGRRYAKALYLVSGRC